MAATAAGCTDIGGDQHGVLRIGGFCSNGLCCLSQGVRSYAAICDISLMVCLFDCMLTRLFHLYI